MFDIGWPEMMVVVLVLIIVVGPKDLPRVLRTVAKWVSKARGMAREFQHSLDDIARQADLDDVKRELSSITSPDMSKELANVIDPTISGMDYPVEKQEQPAAATAQPSAPAATPVSTEPVGPPPADDGTGAAPAEEALAVAQERAEVSDEPPAERAAGA